MPDRLPKVQHSRQPHDTADWCADRAAADRIAAEATDNDNIRERFEISAASWLARADMLRTVANGTRARAKAHDEDLPSRAQRRAIIAGLHNVRL